MDCLSDVDVEVHCDPSKSHERLLIWFHGGGLKEGDKREVIPFSGEFCAHGIAVISANYRLHPSVFFPENLYDAADVVARVLRHYSDREMQVFIGGYSAGAYLANLLILDDRHLRDRGTSVKRISGVISLSSAMSTHPTVRFERGIKEKGVYLDEAAPLFHVSKKSIPWLLMVGDDDMPGRKEENELFVQKMREIGNDQFKFRVFEGRNHQSILKKLAEPQDPVMKEMVRFIQDISRRPMKH